MDSNRTFTDFRELLANETIYGGQIVVISCGNVRKAETLMNSPKITDPSKILIHVGENDTDDQYPEDIASNLITIAKKFQEKFKCMVYLSDITPQNDHFQGHVQVVNQMLAYKISKSNIQKVSHSNLSPNYLHDDRHLKRNRSAGKMISGVELLCSYIYQALIGKAYEPETQKKSLQYTHRNNRYMKSSFLYSGRNKYQTYYDGKSNTARPITPNPSVKLNNYLYPQHYGHNQNYMHTPTDRWYPLYQSCKMVSKFYGVHCFRVTVIVLHRICHIYLLAV